jgi:hypothetical protein
VAVFQRVTATRCSAALALRQPKSLLHPNDRRGMPNATGGRGYLALVEHSSNLPGGHAGQLVKHRTQLLASLRAELDAATKDLSASDRGKILAGLKRPKLIKPP